MQDSNNITDQAFWDAYWRRYEYEQIPRKTLFERFMPLLTQGKSFIEIGGFPGVYAAYFFRHGIPDVTLLDFHLNREIVRNFEKRNALPENCIQCIHADFFNFSSEKKYDIVFSSGFIEHFQDTSDVIARHVELLSEKGQLLILLPNFLGVNGAIQRRFDRDNLDAHNLKSMEPAYLKKIMSGFPLRNISVTYIGKPMVWLEPKPENRKYKKWIKTFSYLCKLVPIKGRFLSPYIAIYARK